MRRRLLCVLLLSFLFGIPVANLQAGQVWEVWSRFAYSKDMTTEWLVADDRGWDIWYPPDQIKFYLLVPPVINKVDDHWEITFDVSGQKKKQLAEHYDNGAAFKHYPNNAAALPQGVKSWYFPPPFAAASGNEPWLILLPKANVDGKLVELNCDPDKTGTPVTYNLDPEDAVGICFIEPVVTEKDGEWVMTMAATPVGRDLENVMNHAKSWRRLHPGPHVAKAPQLRYPPNLQKRYDAFQKAFAEWMRARQGMVPTPDSFLQLTPDQRLQEAKWANAVTGWTMTNGDAAAYPQPVDYITDSPN